MPPKNMNSAARHVGVDAFVVPAALSHLYSQQISKSDLAHIVDNVFVVVETRGHRRQGLR